MIYTVVYHVAKKVERVWRCTSCFLFNSCSFHPSYYGLHFSLLSFLSVLLPSITSLFTAFVPACTAFVIFKPFFLSSHLPHLICLLSSPLCCPVSCVSAKIDADGTPPSCRMYELSRRRSMWKLGWTEAGRNKAFKSFHHIFAPSDNVICFGLTTKAQCVAWNECMFVRINCKNR